MIKQCTDGYPTCRKAEATGQWCLNHCEAINKKPTDKMPHYEIEITARKMICVKAEDEDQALEIAEENVDLGWDSSNVRTEDEYDEANPQHAKWIAEYKQSGDYFSA